MPEDKTTPAPLAARRTRRSKDVSEEVRAWLWLANIRDRAPAMGYDRLDDAVFPKEALRPRALWRVAREGHSPDRCHPRRGFSLVDRFDAKDPWGGTAAIYRSEFWKVVGPRVLTREELETVRQSLLRTLGFYQPDKGANLAEGEFPDAFAAFAPVGADDFVEQLSHIAPTHDLDFLALACVLFRLAMADMDLDLAVALRPYIRNYFHDMLDALEMGRFGLDGDVPFAYLVEQRVFRGDVSLPAEWAFNEARFLAQLVADRMAMRASRPPKTLPSQQRHLMKRAAMANVLQRAVPERRPLLRMSPLIEAFEQARPALREAHVRVVEARLAKNMEACVERQRLLESSDDAPLP